MRLAVMVLACGLASCGRVGFDARGDGGAGPTGDGANDTAMDGIPSNLVVSLFAWYPLDDDIAGSGMTRDASGHGRTMTCSPAVRCPRSTAGRGAATAGLFDSAGRRLWQPTGTKADLPRFTAAAWIKLERRPSDFEMVVARPIAGGSANSFGLDHATSGLLEYYSEGGASLFSMAMLPIGTWTHVALAYDGTTKFIFINGSTVGSGSTGVPVTYDASPLIIGADITSGAVDHNFQGSIADVMIFDRALSQDEVRLIAQ